MTVHQESTSSVGGIHEVQLADRDEHRIDGRHAVDLARRRASLEATYTRAVDDWAFMLDAVGEQNADFHSEVLGKLQADIDKAARKLTAIEEEIVAVHGTVPFIS